MAQRSEEPAATPPVPVAPAVAHERARAYLAVFGPRAEPPAPARRRWWARRRS